MSAEYERYLPQLRETALFRDLDDDEILELLNAMQPPVVYGRPEGPGPSGIHESFRMVVASNMAPQAAPRRFKFDFPAFGEPGSMMGEILALSEKERFLKPTPLDVKPKLPEFEGTLTCLEFNPDMLTCFYSVKISPIQGRMLRNFLGMLAQKVVDTRRKLTLERTGFDMYAPENLVDRATVDDF